ncbi:MAG: phosphotransferase [Chloroflexi bacterium]|nr:phosphotransferase [Chloroflexota bacterium]
MQGRASTVTDLGDGTVLRTGGDPEREAAIMAHARAHGFPVPVVHEVRADGMVLERIDGPTMSDHLVRRPWLLARSMRLLAALHARLHEIRFDGARLVHYDLHPQNVMLPSDGPIVIDWTNAHAGSPDGDVAMTWLILATSAGVPGRVAARLFRSQVGRGPIRRGLPDATRCRLSDPNVTAAERERVRRAIP